MGQITETFARQMLVHCERNEHPPLTVWEAKQLAHAWLELQRLRATPVETGCSGELRAVCEEIRNKAQSSVGNYGLGNFVAIHRELLGSMCAILDRTTPETNGDDRAQLHDALSRIVREAKGCSRSDSREFHAWTITSITKIAKDALAHVPAPRTYVAVVEPHHDRMKIGDHVVMIERVYEALGMDLPVCPHGMRYVENTCGPCSQGRPNRPAVPHVEPFVVKHYAADERPTIKGNGFDGLEVGTDREDAEDFVKWLNERLPVKATAPLFPEGVFQAADGNHYRLERVDAPDESTGRIERQEPMV